MKKLVFLILIFCSNNVMAKGYDIFGIGLYDVKFDGSQANEAADFRFERRFDKSLVSIGPENYDFFDLKPFIGFETTSDRASYFLAQNSRYSLISFEPEYILVQSVFNSNEYE